MLFLGHLHEDTSAAQAVPSSPSKSKQELCSPAAPLLPNSHGRARRDSLRTTAGRALGAAAGGWLGPGEAVSGTWPLPGAALRGPGAHRAAAPRGRGSAGGGGAQGAPKPRGRRAEPAALPPPAPSLRPGTAAPPDAPQTLLPSLRAAPRLRRRGRRLRLPGAPRCPEPLAAGSPSLPGRGVSAAAALPGESPARCPEPAPPRALPARPERAAAPPRSPAAGQHEPGTALRPAEGQLPGAGGPAERQPGLPAAGRGVVRGERPAALRLLPRVSPGGRSGARLVPARGRRWRDRCRGRGARRGAGSALGSLSSSCGPVGPVIFPLRGRSGMAVFGGGGARGQAGASHPSRPWCLPADREAKGGLGSAVESRARDVGCT